MPAPRALFCLLTALLSLAAAVPVAGESPDPVLRRRLRVEAWNAPLMDLMRTVSRETGVTLRISPALIPPEEVPDRRVFLDTGEVSLGLLLEFLSRDLDCRYRLDGPDAVWLSAGYDWLSREEGIHEPVPYRHRVGTLLSARQTPSDFLQQTLEAIRIHALLDDAFVTLEEPHLGIVAMLPPRLRDTLHETLLAMSEPGLPLDNPVPDTMDPSLARLVQDLRRRRILLHYRDQPLPAVLRDISTQAGVTVVLSAAAASRLAEKSVSLDTGEISAQEGIDRLRESLGLSGVELYPGGGVRLTDSALGWPRHAAISRAFLWEEAVVRAYDVYPLEARYPSGDDLARYIRERVQPDAWLDPATGIVFHEPSGNLIVVASPDLQERVHAELSRTALALERSGGTPSPGRGEAVP